MKLFLYITLPLLTILLTKLNHFINMITVKLRQEIIYKVSYIGYLIITIISVDLENETAIHLFTKRNTISDNKCFLVNRILSTSGSVDKGNQRRCWASARKIPPSATLSCAASTCKWILLFCLWNIHIYVQLLKTSIAALCLLCFAG